MNKTPLSAAALAGLLLPWIVACGAPQPTYPHATLAGTVTVAGQPLTEGKIMFLPQDPHRGGGVTAVIRNGRYRAEEVPHGKVLVTFNAMQETGRMIESSSTDELQPERIDLIPPEYADGLVIEVQADREEQHFAL